MLHPRLECTAIDVPLDWDDPEGELIEIPAVRVRTEQERKGQMWLLDGGPGGSGLGFLFQGVVVEEYLDAGWDVVIPNHRGTITPDLRCAPGTATLASCREELTKVWGDGLRHFNTVTAAYDLGELIARYQVDNGDDSTIVYGVSYGTYWALFYLGLHPTQADGVVLDSVLSADVDVVAQEALNQDKLEELLQRCVDDPTCGPRVGFASGAAFADAVVTALDEGDCGSGDAGQWSASAFRDLFGQLLNRARVRNFIPLLVAMLERCTEATSQQVVTAISELQFAGFGDAPPTQLPFGIDGSLFSSGEILSIVASTTIVADDAEFDAAVEAARDNVATIGTLFLLAGSDPVWGDLPNVAFDPDFEAEIPVLILGARYDAQTPLPWAEDTAAQLGRTLHVFEDARHGLAGLGSGGAGLGDMSPCARPMILEFAADPDAPTDASCIETLPEIDVNLDADDLQDLAVDAFGVSDPWTLLEE